MPGLFSFVAGFSWILVELLCNVSCDDNKSSESLSASLLVSVFLLMELNESDGFNSNLSKTTIASMDLVSSIGVCFNTLIVLAAGVASIATDTYIENR